MAVAIPGPLCVGPRVVVPLLNSSVTTSLITLADGSAGISAAAGEALEVLSGSANDTAAGTGARTVTFLYLDVNGALQTETISLNGTGVVASVATNVWRILDFWVATVGSGGTNAGAITLREATGDSNRCQIAIARMRVNAGYFAVPAGYEFWLHGVDVGASDATSGTPLLTHIHVDADIDPANGNVNRDVYVKVLNGTCGLNNRRCQLVPPTGSWGMRFGPLSTIRVRAVTETGTVAVAGQMWGTLRPLDFKKKGSGPDPDQIWKI